MYICIYIMAGLHSWRVRWGLLLWVFIYYPVTFTSIPGRASLAPHYKLMDPYLALLIQPFC